MSLVSSELWAKDVQFLKQLVPAATVVAYLVNPTNPSVENYLTAAKAGANALGIDVRVFNASTEQDLDEVFVSLEKSGAGGLVVPNEPFLDSRRDKIVALSARYAVPTIYSIREYVVSGGLLSYGASLADSYRRAAVYLGRVLKGEKPADLPVQQPTKFELVINLKTAKALGLTIPSGVLSIADEIIE